MAFSTINKGSDYMNTVLYTGSGAIQAVTGVGFQPDLVWCKDRDSSRHHYLADVIRGVKGRLRSDVDNAEYTAGATDGFDSFDSDGFTLEEDAGSLGLNESGESQVSWNWKMGTTTGIAGSPSITPTSYSFNATAGQSIIKYVGNGTSGATIPHGLSTAPKMVIIKNLTTQEGWVVGHEGIRGSGLGWTKIMKLNTNAAPVTSSAYFEDVAPSATLVTLGDDGGVNTNTDNYIAYCFSEISGYSKFGKYKANDSDYPNSPFIYTGFKPQFIMFKNISGTANWLITDNKRRTYNPTNLKLFANDDAAEATDEIANLLSNGFKLDNSIGDINYSTNEYIYMAFGQPIISNSGVCATAW